MSAPHAAAVRPDPKPGCTWQDAYLAHAVIPAECRWEDIESGDGEVVGRLIVIEGVWLNGCVVKAQHLPETLIEEWAVDIADRIDADERESEMTRQIDAYQTRRAA